MKMKKQILNLEKVSWVVIICIFFDQQKSKIRTRRYYLFKTQKSFVMTTFYGGRTDRLQTQRGYKVFIL